AVGHDNVDVVAAEMRRVTVTNTPAVLTDATADLAWALILACARHVVPGAQLVQSASWTGWHPELLLGIELRGRTLGLFGAGRIGQAVGRRAVPFGMRILYTARNPRPDFERESGAVRVEFSRLLKESDVLSLHVPSVPETKGIIDADTLRQMKPGAILINTARGDLVREEALAQALEEGRLGGAGLDVYLDEPAVHARLRAAPRSPPPPRRPPSDAPNAQLDALRHATLGEYEILAELGRGGMATVHLAHDLALDRKVAIKVLAPALLAMGEGMVERFKREARTAAALSHPHIIPIYAVKESEHVLYFVMKYV